MWDNLQRQSIIYIIAKLFLYLYLKIIICTHFPFDVYRNICRYIVKKDYRMFDYRRIFVFSKHSHLIQLWGALFYENPFNFNRPNASIFLRCHRVCTGTKCCARVAYTPARTRVWRLVHGNVRTESGLSVCAETAHGIDPTIFKHEHLPIIAENGVARGSSRENLSHVAEEIVGRSTIVTGNSTIGDSSARQNVGLHHRLFLLLRRITAPRAADDDTPGRVQAFQVCIVRRCTIFAESWKKWHPDLFFAKKNCVKIVKKIILHSWEFRKLFKFILWKGKLSAREIVEGNRNKRSDPMENYRCEKDVCGYKLVKFTLKWRKGMILGRNNIIKNGREDNYLHLEGYIFISPSFTEERSSEYELVTWRIYLLGLEPVF